MNYFFFDEFFSSSIYRTFFFSELRIFFFAYIDYLNYFFGVFNLNDVQVLQQNRDSFYEHVFFAFIKDFYVDVSFVDLNKYVNDIHFKCLRIMLFLQIFWLKILRLYKIV